MKKANGTTNLVLFLIVMLVLTSSHASASALGDAGGVAEETNASLLVELPVKAVYRKQLENGHARDVIGVVHAVRRVPGATTVYASQGFSEHEKKPNYGDEEWYDLFGEDRTFTYASLVDPKSKRYWFPYRIAGEPACLCPTSSVRPVYRFGVNDSKGFIQ